MMEAHEAVAFVQIFIGYFIGYFMGRRDEKKYLDGAATPSDERSS